MANRKSYLGLSAYWFATSLKWFILFFLLPSLVTSIVDGGEKNRWWGLIVAIGAAEAMIGPALMGWLSDRSKSKWGKRRPFIAIGAALSAIALLYMGNANTIASLMVAYLLVQISDDVGTGPYSSTIPDLVPIERRGLASGQMGLLQLLGQVAAVGIGLAYSSSPATIFMVLAGVNIACAAISIFSISKLESGREESVVVESSKPRTPLWEAFKNDDFRWAWGTRFLNALGFYIILNYLVNFLDDVIQVFDAQVVQFQEPFEAAIALAALLSLTGAASSLINGSRADKVGRKRVVKEAGWIMFVPLVAFCFVQNYLMLVPLAILFGVGYGAYLSSDWALVSDVLPDKASPARDMGVWQMSVAMPQVFAGLIGFLIDSGNAWQHGAGYRIAFLTASLAMLAGSLLVGRIKGST